MGRHFRIAVLSLLICSALGCHEIFAQNLVTNGDFEQYNKCPDLPQSARTIPYSPGWGTFPYVKDWISPAMTAADYFHACGIPHRSVPANSIGYQRARSGNAYAGIGTWGIHALRDTTRVHREFITTKLSSPMVKDSTYCVRFYVNPSFYNPDPNYFTPIVVNDIGANLSAVRPNFPHANYPRCLGCSDGSYSINLRYDVINPPSQQLVNDSIWYEIRGFFVAKGGEEWLTIGKLGRGTPPSLTPGWTSAGNAVFIDDVSVLPLFTRKHGIVDCDSALNGQALLSSSLDSGIYEWSTGATTKSISVRQPGTYTCITYNDLRYVIDSFTVKADTISSFRQVPACGPDGVAVLLDAALPGASYSWNTGETTPAIRPAVPGYYVCRSVNACTVVTDSFLVTTDAYDSLYLVPVCDTAGFSKTIEASVASPYYRWSTGETGRQITATRTGDYTCELFNGCHIIRETYQVAVEVPSPPVVRDTVFCQFVEAPLIRMQDTGILWYTVSTASTGSPYQPRILTTGPGSIMLYVSRRYRDCISAKSAIRVSIKPTPVRHGSDSLFRCDGIVNYAERIGAPAVGGINYSWSSGQKTSSIIPEKDGLYLLNAFNECASVVDTFFVRSQACDACVTFPDAFTPDGNGVNDGFGAIVRCPVSQFNLKVYNRWGQEVYSSGQLTGRWSGNQHGRPAPAGVYMYLATVFQERTGKKFLLKGEVTLIR